MYLVMHYYYYLRLYVQSNIVMQVVESHKTDMSRIHKEKHIKNPDTCPKFF